MSLKDFVAVSGKPGLYKLLNTRNNGLVVEDIDTGRSHFFSMRKHQFTPMETVAIYTEEDAIEMKDVFQRMKTMEEADTPPPPNNAKVPELFDYFEDVIPDYDKDRVSIGDVRKVMKWYRFLADRDLLNPSEDTNEEE